MTRLRALSLAKSTNYGPKKLHTLSAVPRSDSSFPIPRAPSPTRVNAPQQSTQQSNPQNNPPATSSVHLAPSAPGSPSSVSPVLHTPTASHLNYTFLPSRSSIISPRPRRCAPYYRLLPAVHGLPKPRPRALPSTDDSLHLAHQVGEDAYFIRPDALGVADGVGGWASQKHQRPTAPPANSALFSRRLLHYCCMEMELHPSTDPDPVEILQRGYETSVGLSLADGLAGSSTVLLAVLAKEARELRIAHVGDCCAYVIREQEIVFRTVEMQHHVSLTVSQPPLRDILADFPSLPPMQFNYPFQLGPLSPTSPREHAQRLNVPVQENDIVILSTDGMTDNLWDEDVIQQVIRFTSTMPPSPSVLSTYPNQPLSSVRSALLPITLSHALCTKARSVAENGSPITDGELPEIPFGRRAKEAGHSFAGGKQDGKLISSSYPIWSTLVTRRP